MFPRPHTPGLNGNDILTSPSRTAFTREATVCDAATALENPSAASVSAVIAVGLTC